MEGIACSAQKKAFFDKFIAVLGQGLDGDEPFDRIGELCKESERGDARNDCIVFLADLVLHIGDGIERIDVAFCLGCIFFTGGGLCRRLNDKFFIFGARLFGRDKTLLDDAVNAKIGIAADGGSKVAVTL